MHILKIIGLVLTGAGLALAAGALFLFSLFQAPKLIAGWIPGSVAGKIGLHGVALAGPATAACNEGAGADALLRILDRLQSGGSYGRRFQLHIVGGDMENAFALPGRHIVLVSGLIRRAKAPEEVAAVLAHEMGHGLENDPEALFLRNIGVTVLFKFLRRDDDSAAAFRAMLSQLRYSRDAERSADAHAVAILRRARIGAKPAGEFILRSAAESPAGESVMSDLGAYPTAEERAAFFLAQPTYPTEPILSEEEWAAARAVCGAAR
jgi:Zn-dependent protease with chaperone function